MSKKLLSETKLAERWEIAPKTLANQRCRGEGVPFIRLGRMVRYDPDVVAAYEAAHMFNSTSEAA
jgi:hypothetical protein